MDCLKTGAGYVESSCDNHARCVRQLFVLNIRHSNKVYVQQGQVLKYAARRSGPPGGVFTELDTTTKTHVRDLRLYNPRLT